MARRKRKRGFYGGGSYICRGGRHIIQWYEADGTRGTKSFKDEGAARAMLDSIGLRVARGMRGLADVETRSSSTLAELAKDWLASRRDHESHYDDVGRWQNHWAPLVGGLHPDAVDVVALKSAMLALREKGLSKASVKLCVALLSSFYSDLVEERSAKFNPVRMLSKKTRREFLKSDHDPKKVPFIREPADITRIYEHLLPLSTSVAVAYLVGAMAGLRTSELRCLDWAAVDLDARTITVSEQAQRRKGKAPEKLTANGKAQVKDGEIRVVPIQDALYPILVEQRERTGGRGPVCPPILGMRGGAARGPLRRFIGEHGMHKLFNQTRDALGIEPMIWYQATRHTFASQWVLHGGSLEKLQEILGHSSVMVTERYAHLMPGRFTDEDRSRMADLRAPKASAPLAAKFLEN